MKLLIRERIALLDLLPKQDDYAGYSEIIKVRSVLGFTSDELLNYQIAQEGASIRWTREGDSYLADLPISEYIHKRIQDVLRDLNKQKKLDDKTYSLYQKFIVDYDQV